MPKRPLQNKSQRNSSQVIRTVYRKRRLRHTLINATVIGIAALIIVGAVWALFPSSNSKAFNELVGQQAPDFSLQTYTGATIKLSSYLGKNVVLFFSEGIMCQPACTDQINALDNDARFSTTTTAQFSIVVDQASMWSTMMSQKPSMETSLLFDSTKTVATAYGVLTLPSSMHPGNTPGHSYVIVDKQGIIRFAFDDTGMGINNDELANALSTIP